MVELLRVFMAIFFAMVGVGVVFFCFGGVILRRALFGGLGIGVFEH